MRRRSDELELTEFETRVTLRNLEPKDFDAVADLQKRCFPTMSPWTREQFESMVTIFPDGQFGIELDGQLVASSSSLIVDYSDYADWHDWRVISDDGYIRNHDPDGDTLYGIEIQVDPEYRGMKLARRLYEARKRLVRDLNLARMVIGGRIPGYGKHQDEMSAQQYVQRVKSSALFDPVLTTQLANGFVLQQLVPDYLPTDEDSAGYATILEWPNLDYLPQPSRRKRHAVDPARCAVVQYAMRRIKTFDEFATQVEFFVDTASDSKSDFVLFPELFTVQLLSMVDSHRPGQAARQLAKFNPSYLELFTDLAVRYNVNIIGGSNFVMEGEELKNIAYLFRRDGTLGKQYKIHITPTESRWWGISGGDRVEVFDSDSGRVAILVGYDIEFPELTRIATSKGANILFVPFNSNDRYGYLRIRICAQARCIENQLYVVAAGCVGNLPFIENADTHHAQSGIFTPSDIPFARDGVAAVASPNLEAVLIHDLDVQILRRARRTGTVTTWNDRRSDLYRLHWREDDDEYSL